MAVNEKTLGGYVLNIEVHIATIATCKENKNKKKLFLAWTGAWWSTRSSKRGDSTSILHHM